MLSLIDKAEPLTDSISSTDGAMIVVSHVLLTETLFGAASIFRSYSLEYGYANGSALFDKEYNRALSGTLTAVRNKLNIKN
jgi:hypothetical protein